MPRRGTQEFKSLICYRDDISIHLNEWKPGILCILFCRNSCKICVKSSLRHKPLTTIKLLEITLSKVCTQAILARRRTFAVFIFSRLLLFHFFHILHICRVHLSLVFAAQGDTGGAEGKVSQNTALQIACTELTPITKLLLTSSGRSCQQLSILIISKTLNN